MVFPYLKKTAPAAFCTEFWPGVGF